VPPAPVSVAACACTAQIDAAIAATTMETIPFERLHPFIVKLLCWTLVNFDTGESREYAGIWEFSAFFSWARTLPRPQ
jgi:hypothetical protein